ncbi:hypothetical protein B0H14DRAFT_2596124 [Mycena olivaceomarginata]|nr:hypothetical protein B0H14DRAFT_2596124 [Mycena olivaceomarginata]
MSLRDSERQCADLVISLASGLRKVKGDVSVLKVIQYITGSFENGTAFNVFVEGEGGATVTSDGNASSGSWNGTGLGWAHASGPTTYTVELNATQVGVEGTIEFNAISDRSSSEIAPAHYPCGPAVAGQNMNLGAGIGWANAVPDAQAVVNVKINGSSLAFDGAGYHDKNWGAQPFVANVNSWYWGHGQIGPHSIVWFDFLALNGTEYVSAYASESGAIVSASCAPNALRARPTGDNDTYPPHRSTGDPSGYHVTLDLGGNGTLVVDASITGIPMDNVLDEYSR